jgi:hypothetical protein
MSDITDDIALGGSFGGSGDDQVQVIPTNTVGPEPTTNLIVTDDSSLGGSFGENGSPEAITANDTAVSAANEAKVSQAAAYASELAAAASASSALTSETNVASSADASAASASQSAASAISSETSAVNAETSNLLAAQHVVDAENEALAASNSASGAAASAAAAAASEASAESSDISATTASIAAQQYSLTSVNSAAASASSAAASLASADLAETSEDNAALSEANAAASSTAASDSEDLAMQWATSVSLVDSTAFYGAYKYAQDAAASATVSSQASATAVSEAQAASASETNATASATEASLSANASETSAAASAASATQAGSSATQALDYKNQALTAAQNAQASETSVAANAVTASAAALAASTSETNAGLSEVNAINSEAAAASSAVSAASSASAAQLSADAANVSEANAVSSALEASLSEAASFDSETNADISEASALVSKDAAAASAASASTSASAAAVSETNASSSELAASGSATDAANSATASAASATASATSATNSAGSAATSLTAQAASEAARDAALAAFDSFDDRYLGQKTDDPTTDNDGDPLVAGTLYFNTTTDTMKVYEGAQWVAAYASLAGVLLATNNLSDLTDVSAARTNLDLGTIATADAEDYLLSTGGIVTGTIEAPLFEGDLSGAQVFPAKAGEAITKGDALYISGISGNTPIVMKANASDFTKMPSFGVSQTTVSANANVNCVTYGQLHNIDTTPFSLGDQLYVSTTSGELTATAPAGETSLIQNLGKVERVHASTGALFIAGAGRANATPNLDSGNFFLGNGSNQAVSADFDTSVTNIALPLAGGALTGAVTTTSTFDGRDVSVDGAKLDGIETNATADQTASEIKTAYESNANTNAYTDSEKTKLTGIETNATADQTAAEIRALVEAAADSNVFTNADHSKLDGIESNATADQTASEIKSAYESNANTNAFTDADHTKLDGIAANANNYVLPFTDNSTNWNTAYSWGDHAAAGYITSATGFLPLTGGTLTGALEITGNGDLLNLRAPVNGNIVRMTFSSNVPDTQVGHIEYTHGNTASYGSGEAFYIGGTESTTTILADGKLMFKEGIYLKPATGTGAGTRKDLNWDTAYGWGNHASAGYLPSSSYTASDVLTKIKTVDGSGSGLDADLLDGIDSTGFVKQLADGTSPDYQTPSSRRVDPTTSNPTNAHHAISTFGNGSNVTGQLATHFVSGEAYTRGYNNAWSAWRTQWDSLNDGSGSGLDADLLDGQQGSYYAPASRTYLPTAGNYVWDANSAASTYNVGLQTSFVRTADNWPSYGAVLHVGARGGEDAGGDFQIYCGHGSAYGGNYLRVRNADNDTVPSDSWTAWRTIWDSGNDGSGSGLDADLLDGQQGSYYYPASNPNGYTSNTGTMIETGTTFSGTYPLSFRIGSNNYYSHGNITYTGSTGTLNSTAGNYSTTSTANRFTTNSGYIELGPMNTSWAHIYTDRSNFYFNRELYVNGNLVWNAGTDGSGSGLDADTVDGIQGGSFLRSDVSDVYNGRVLEFGTAGNGTNTSGAFLTIEGNTDSSGEGSGRLFFREHNSSTAAADAYGMSLGYRGGSTSVTTARGNTWTGLAAIGNGEWGMWGHDGYDTGSLVMHGPRNGSYVDFSNALVGGSQVWHAGNDGSGSGLDADLLDGRSSSITANAYTIALRDGNGHLYGNYILGSYFNASSGNSENPTIGQIWTQNTSDNYLRKSTPAHFANQMSGYFLRSDAANTLTLTMDAAGNNYETGASIISIGVLSSSTSYNYHMVFKDANGTVKGRITNNTYGTQYTTSSDYRLKEDIQPVEDATSRILDLNVRNFLWSGTDCRTDGFLAHELAEVVPEAVVGEKDAVLEDGTPNYQTVDQTKLIPLLVKTIQELEARIKLLENN